jgi:succinoglycan biosynthesis protein ExoO
MLISIIMPAYRAHGTIARAVGSLLAQTWQDWEAIVVSDDGADYQALLRRAGLRDERLRFVSTGRVGSGCHHARNVGLAAARGEFVGALDADDVFLPTRLARLQPAAAQAGAAADNTVVVAEATGVELYRAFSAGGVPRKLDIATLLDLTVPLVPLVARDYAEPRLEGIEFGEDFVANLRLIERQGAVAMLDDGLYEYRVVAGSLAHSEASFDNFERCYSDLIVRLESGDRLGLSQASAAAARHCLIRKRDFNRAFAAALAQEPGLDFQTFAARETSRNIAHAPRRSKSPQR